MRIDRCIVRAVRRGGWSWGEDRQRLIEAIRRLVPLLVVRYLAEGWPDDAIVEVSAPIRLTVSLRAADVVRLIARADVVDAVHADVDLERRVEDAVRVAVSRAVEETARRHDARVARAELPKTQRRRSGIDALHPLLRLLTAWHRAGDLVPRLCIAPHERLEAWHRSLGRAAADGGQSPGATDAVAEQTVARTAALEAFAADADQSARALRIAILTIVDVFARTGYVPRVDRVDVTAFADGARHRALDDVDAAVERGAAPAPPAEVATSRTAADGAPAPVNVRADDRTTPLVPAGLQRAPDRRRATPQARLALGDERHITSALPFLILGPLARMGYLDALAATCDAGDCLAGLPLAGAALAYKVLGLPSRGWRRDPADEMAAATVAGLDAVVNEADLARLAHDVAPHLAIADGELMRSVQEGHVRARPMLLQRTSGPGDAEPGYLLAELDGLFPVAWRPSIRELADACGAFSGETLLVPVATASGDVLAALDLYGWRFVTDAAPGRDEPWRALRRPRVPRLWTNDFETPIAELVARAGTLQSATDLMGDFWRALAIDRPAAIHAADRAFDLSVTLAAAVALADIAWTLWRERETTSGLLTLMRFADFDARVRFDADTVRVRVPLGRRHQDLMDHGLLRDVTDVPWLGGRTLRFAGG
ncbi:MAG: hypothetical protein ACHQO8_04060 [Vicinamibacterales bacterium]